MTGCRSRPAGISPPAQWDGAGWPGGRDEDRVLRVRHLGATDPESGAPNTMTGRLVRLGRVLCCRVAPHRELPGGHLPPLDPGCRHPGQRGITGRTMWDGRSASTYTVCSATTWCVCLPIGSPVFGFTSRRGQFDEETSTRIR